MDHPDVTYEEYLELVAKGEGKIEVATYDEDKPDQEEPEVTLIDPRKGFSFVWVGDDLPIKYWEAEYRFGSSKERILLSSRISAYFVKAYRSSYSDRYGEKAFKSILFSESFANSTLSVFGFLTNRCIIRENIKKGCGSIIPDEINKLVRKLIINPLIDFTDGNRSEPPFSIVQ